MTEHPFSFLAKDLAWLERALTAALDSDAAMNSEAGWGKYWAKVEQVRAAERSVRRSMTLTHCVFGPGNNHCQEKWIHNCDSCEGRANEAARAWQAQSQRKGVA